MAYDVLLFMTWRIRADAPRLEWHQADRLSHMLPTLARREHAWLVEVAVLPNHVHVIAETPLNVVVPQLAQRMKGASSRLLNLDRGAKAALHWANGYDVRSIGRKQLPLVQAYLDTQDVRHHMQWVVRWTRKGAQDDHRDAPLEELQKHDSVRSLVPSGPA